MPPADCAVERGTAGVICGIGKFDPMATVPLPLVESSTIDVVPEYTIGGGAAGAGAAVRGVMMPFNNPEKNETTPPAAPAKELF